ncbi:MAG: D-alanyl-D-alanine carboxypeptidase family protein [Candidatus Sumerlaeaceae bacterium]
MLVCVLFAPGLRAAESDDAAMPVRKASAKKASVDSDEKSRIESKKPGAKTSARTEKTKTSAGRAAAKESSTKTKKKPAADSGKTSASEKPASNATARSRTQAKTSDDPIAMPVRSKASRRTQIKDEEPEVETPAETQPATTEPVDLPDPQVTRSAALAAPASTLPPPAATNSQSAPGTGFFRRLFSRRSNRTQTQTTQQQPLSFNTDYATRAAGAIIPVVLPGFGWGGVDLPIGSEDPYRLSTLPSDFRPTDLVLLPKDYSYYKNPIYLRQEAAHSLTRMFNDAAREGLTLKIFSGYRDYAHQQRLYTQAVSRNKNQNTVARPGKSEHQLGTTADVTNNAKYLMKRSFAETPEGKWLVANGARYGWKMTVLRGTGPRSHADEPWHIRYLGSNVNAANQVVQQPQQQPQRRSLLGRLGGLFGRRG